MEYVVLVKRQRCFQCGVQRVIGEVVTVEDDRVFCLDKGCVDVYRRDQEKGAKR